MAHRNLLRRKALVIGTSYQGNSQISNLRDPLQDTHDIHKYLTTVLKVPNEDITVLTSHEDTSYDSLRSQLDTLFEQKHVDELFLHVSAHGNRIPDTSGDELDGIDEILMSSDTGKHILDDVFVDYLDNFNKRFIANVDICFGGSWVDTPKQVPGDVIVMTASTDKQPSIEYSTLHDSYGLHTTVFLDQLLRDGGETMTVEQLHFEIARTMKKLGEPQIPQLYVSQPSLLESPLFLT